MEIDTLFLGDLRFVVFIILQCVERARLSPAEVEKCVLMGKGTMLQLESEYHTSLVKPKFVPTVTINGVSL